MTPENNINAPYPSDPLRWVRDRNSPAECDPVFRVVPRWAPRSTARDCCGVVGNIIQESRIEMGITSPMHLARGRRTFGLPTATEIVYVVGHCFSVCDRAESGQ